jgi:hypothetical protein
VTIIIGATATIGVVEMITRIGEIALESNGESASATAMGIPITTDPA